MALDGEKAERFKREGARLATGPEDRNFTPSFGFISPTAEATLAPGEGEGLLG